MKRIWIVAVWEFLGTVIRPGFLATIAGLPLFHLGFGFIMVHSLGAVAREAALPRPVVIVDAAHVLHSERHTDAIVADEAEAVRRLQARQADGVFVLADDYLLTGRVRAYSRMEPGLSHVPDLMNRRERARGIIRDGLLASRPPDPVVSRAADPIPSLDAFTVDREGRAHRDTGSPFAVVGGAFGVSLLLCIAIFMSSGLLQQVMVAERQNRMLEVLLVSIDPLPLLTGKLLGLSAAGLIQVAAYLAFVLAGASEALGLVNVPMTTFGWSAACFLAGYVLYGGLTAATGALGRSTQESAQIAAVWMLVGAVPLFLLGSVTTDGTSALSRTLTWIPLTAPVTLLLRVGTGSISALETAGALLLTLSTAAGALTVAAGLLRRVTNP